jgi:hypothetical protein
VTESELSDRVTESLGNALMSGYEELLRLPPREVAADLSACDADLEDVPVEHLLPHVRAWQREREVSLGLGEELSKVKFSLYEVDAFEMSDDLQGAFRGEFSSLAEARTYVAKLTNRDDVAWHLPSQLEAETPVLTWPEDGSTESGFTENRLPGELYLLTAEVPAHRSSCTYLLVRVGEPSC